MGDASPLQFKYWFQPSSLKEFLVTCQHQATASDLPFYDRPIFAPTKNFSFAVSDNVIVSDLWSAPPIKNPGYAYGFNPKPSFVTGLSCISLSSTRTKFDNFVQHKLVLITPLFSKILVARPVAYTAVNRFFKHFWAADKTS